MPKGYKTISIKEHVYPTIANLAKRTRRTVPSLIMFLFETYPEKLLKLAMAGESEKELPIPPELYKKLEQGAEAKGLTVDEYAAQLLRSARILETRGF